MGRLLLTLLVAIVALPAFSGDGFDAEGYRLPPYRSPTPEAVEGAVTLNTEALKTMLSTEPGVVLIDVYNVGYANGGFLQDTPHWTLPGAIWLPNTGSTPLENRWRDYLRRHLKRLTEDDKDRALVFFCRADCWLSWNVAKRIAADGYTAVYWYRNGVDGWREADGKVEAVRPEPFIAEMAQ
ncbi:Rhodanese-related sulfurtransferase [Alloalcanivorax dieselolei B5]|uniref:Rhodanese-related sulfurtransferase n=2 Tax=Alloalcanivorax dieselolei TaxID=285091 RepID=K0CE21_ALCDB|nr:Rhodanese-related sulfurtransferase [Alloalcanivorax dieselolei B5]